MKLCRNEHPREAGVRQGPGGGGEEAGCFSADMRRGIVVSHVL